MKQGLQDQTRVQRQGDFLKITLVCEIIGNGVNSLFLLSMNNLTVNLNYLQNKFSAMGTCITVLGEGYN
jgi:hypothetical protein